MEFVVGLSQSMSLRMTFVCQKFAWTVLLLRKISHSLDRKQAPNWKILFLLLNLSLVHHHPVIALIQRETKMKMVMSLTRKMSKSLTA